MGNINTTILHDDSVKKVTDLIFRAEIFTLRYLAVGTSVKISAGCNAQSRKRKLGWGWGRK